MKPVFSGFFFGDQRMGRASAKDAAPEGETGMSAEDFVWKAMQVAIMERGDFAPFAKYAGAVKVWTAPVNPAAKDGAMAEYAAFWEGSVVALAASFDTGCMVEIFVENSAEPQPVLKAVLDRRAHVAEIVRPSKHHRTKLGDLARDQLGVLGYRGIGRTSRFATDAVARSVHAIVRLAATAPVSSFEKRARKAGARHVELRAIQDAYAGGPVDEWWAQFESGGMDAHVTKERIPKHRDVYSAGMRAKVLLFARPTGALLLEAHLEAARRTYKFSKIWSTSYQAAAMVTNTLRKLGYNAPLFEYRTPHGTAFESKLE